MTQSNHLAASCLDMTTKLWAFLVLQPSVLSHLCTHGCKAPSHWSKQGKKKSRHEVLLTPVVSYSQFIYSFFCDQKPPRLMWLTHYLISSLGGLFCLCGDGENRRPLIWTQGCHNTPPEITHTVWYSLPKYMYFPTSLRNKENSDSFKLFCCCNSAVTLCGLWCLITSAQPPLSLSTVYDVWRAY